MAEALPLRFFAGLNPSEIGLVMVKSDVAIKMLVYRGLREFKARSLSKLEIENVDRELCVAEELDAYVEACQVGQRAECLADIPVDEWCLADKLLRVSAIARPDVQSLAELEIQIFEAARKSVETIVPINNKRTYSSPLYLSPVRIAKPGSYCF